MIRQSTWENPPLYLRQIKTTLFCNHVNKLLTVGMDLAALDFWPSTAPPPRMQENPPCLQRGQFVVTKKAIVVKKVENMMIFGRFYNHNFFDQEKEFNNINTISYMNILMARVDQYISGDHKSSQVTPRLQLISVTEVRDCICCFAALCNLI